MVDYSTFTPSFHSVYSLKRGRTGTPALPLQEQFAPSNHPHWTSGKVKLPSELWSMVINELLPPGHVCVYRRGPSNNRGPVFIALPMYLTCQTLLYTAYTSKKWYTEVKRQLYSRTWIFDDTMTMAQVLQPYHDLADQSITEAHDAVADKLAANLNWLQSIHIACWFKTSAPLAMSSLVGLERLRHVHIDSTAVRNIHNSEVQYGVQRFTAFASDAVPTFLKSFLWCTRYMAVKHGDNFSSIFTFDEGLTTLSATPDHIRVTLPTYIKSHTLPRNEIVAFHHSVKQGVRDHVTKNQKRKYRERPYVLNRAKRDKARSAIANHTAASKSPVSHRPL